MNKKKINKETAIKSILKQLKAGTDKPTILQKLAKTFNNSQRSIYNYYEAAEAQYKEFLSIANPIVRAKEIEALGQLAVSNILSKIERQQLLSDIARGEKKVWKEAVSKDGVVKLESYDPSRYIDILNKMDGSYIQDDPEDEHEFNGFDIQDV